MQKPSEGTSVLGKRRIGDLVTLRRQAKAWNRRANRDKITLKWKSTRKLAPPKLNYSFTRAQYQGVLTFTLNV
jgi:hypothetical protein